MELIKENELPVRELEKLGLYEEGQLTLSTEDLDALLSGRRTDMRSMENLVLEGFAIRQLDAKLYLSRNNAGVIELNLHPIYKEVKPHPLLSEEEIKELLAVKIQAGPKIYEDAVKKQQMLIIQYDEQTREFVGYDPDQVELPLKINGETLNDKQKKAFQNGEVVKLKDGTRIQHSATDRKGIRADRAALILSVLLDGGISYLLIRGIRNLANNKSEQKEAYTKGYNQALADMMMADKKKEAPHQTVGEYITQSQSQQTSRENQRTRSR